MQLDGGYCHVDILRDLLGGGTLRLRYDEDMTGEYYWDQPQTPACPAPIPGGAARRGPGRVCASR